MDTWHRHSNYQVGTWNLLCYRRNQRFWVSSNECIKFIHTGHINIQLSWPFYLFLIIKVIFDCVAAWLIRASRRNNFAKTRRGNKKAELIHIFSKHDSTININVCIKIKLNWIAMQSLTVIKFWFWFCKT